MEKETPLWSISIICKDEEKTFPRLLNSLQNYINLGGEIVVVDTGSTDNTIKVLQDFGFKKYEERDQGRSLLEFSNIDKRVVDVCKQDNLHLYLNYAKIENKNVVDLDDLQLYYTEVGTQFMLNVNEELADKIHETFLDKKDNRTFVIPGKKIINFGKARKYAGSLCSNDWILSVDCDEVFAFLDINFLNHIIRTDDVDQISFNFKYRDSLTGAVNSTTLRDKFYNRKVGDWRWIVHEQVMPKDNVRKHRTCTVTDFTLSLDHYQHPAEHRNNYLVQLCLDVIEDPNDRHIHWLGRELFFSGLYYSAIKLLKIHLGYNAWEAEKCFSCIYIGDCYLALSKKDIEKIKFEKKSLEYYFKAINFAKYFREPWMKIAQVYYDNGDYLPCIQFAKSALLIEAMPQTYMTNMTCYQDMPYGLVYSAYLKINNKKKAHKMWKKAITLAPGNVNYINDVKLFSQTF